MERSARRYQVRLPVRVGEEMGLTRDISTSGIFFETDAGHAVGEKLGLSADLDGTRVRCEGSVVRVEDIDGRVGVAVALTSYRFE